MNHWDALMSIFTGVLATATTASAIALIWSLVLIRRQIDTTRFFEKVKLTTNVMEAQFTFTAVDDLRNLIAERGSVEGARVYVAAKMYEPDPILQLKATRVVGAYAYVALLYDLDLLNSDVVLAGSDTTIFWAFYIFEPIIEEYIRFELYPPRIRNLARHALARIKARSATSVIFPNLIHYSVAD
ncbi:MAG: hypothetical protein ACR2KS_02135 [Candidatus Eremiobacter antarcticus]